MHEHDEARLITYLRCVLDEFAERGDAPTADELLAMIQGIPAAHEYEARQYVEAHRLTPMSRRERADYELHLSDAAAWRRIIADPALVETLLRIEDELLFGDE